MKSLSTLSTLSVGWTWQILGAIRAVATAGEPGEILFSCQVNEITHDFTDFPSAKFHEI